MSESFIPFIAHLLQSGAVRFGEFRLKTGRLSPYFINMADAMKEGSGLWSVSDAYYTVLSRMGPIHYIHGPAYKGIPLAAALAVKCSRENRTVRWGYDRKELKEHGEASGSRLVGEIRSNDRIMIVDDVVTTGRTKLDTILLIEEEARKHGLQNARVTDILVGVDREEPMENGRSVREFFEAHDMGFHSVVTITDILEYILMHYNEKEWIEKVAAVRRYLRERRNEP